MASAPSNRYATEVVVTAAPGADPVELPASLRADSLGGPAEGAKIKLTAWEPDVFTT